jgi:hypothetical protein
VCGSGHASAGALQVRGEVLYCSSRFVIGMLSESVIYLVEREGQGVQINI